MSNLLTAEEARKISKENSASNEFLKTLLEEVRLAAEQNRYDAPYCIDCIDLSVVEETRRMLCGLGYTSRIYNDSHNSEYLNIMW